MAQEMSCLRDIAYTAPFTLSILIWKSVLNSLNQT